MLPIETAALIFLAEIKGIKSDIERKKELAFPETNEVLMTLRTVTRNL